MSPKYSIGEQHRVIEGKFSLHPAVLKVISAAGNIRGKQGV
jgi:hypothetical protein